MLSSPLWAFDVSKVARAITDTVVGFVETVECGKGGCKSVFRPAPGYDSSDRYWTAADLEAHFRDYKDQYSFDNASPPPNALAYLPGNPDQYSNVASAGKISIASGPVAFPLGKYKDSLRKGDIYFTRSATVGAAIGQYITSWFHNGVFINPDLGSTFESQISGGVQVSNIVRLEKSYSWSVKRVQERYLSASQVSAAIDKGLQNYLGKPYFCSVLSNVIRNKFVNKWANKNDNESYYCSKLVWKIFFDAGINLDSERTTAKVSDSYNSSKTGYGSTNSNAWIGVSGDDIYYSPYLSEDIVLIGAENLVHPIPGIAIQSRH
jgi:uncharacterized protein YycO